MKPIADKKIAIIGGGPGGLTLARLLQIKGADVKVFERDANKDVRVQGATLDLHDESGLAALREAGLIEAFKANYRPGADKFKIFDKHGNTLFDEHAQPQNKSFGDEAFRPEIDRGPLRKILLESLHPNTVIWNSHFKSMKQFNDGWELQFNNGNTATADIVIGADGANSKVRSYITPLKPFYCGVTVIEAAIYDSATAVPQMHNLLNDGKIFAFGDEKSLIVSSKGDGSMNLYAGFNADENWVNTCGIHFNDKQQVIDWLKHAYAGWNDIWFELFYTSDYFMPRILQCMPLDQQWNTLPNLTMLGDAAHLMPPYAGEGVNMAMLDALELSNCLTDENFKDTFTALKVYETQMRSRASEVAQISLDQTIKLHSAEAITNMLEITTQP